MYPSSGSPRWAPHTHSSIFKTSRKTIRICLAYRSISVTKRQLQSDTNCSTLPLAEDSYQIHCYRCCWLSSALAPSVAKTENLCLWSPLHSKLGVGLGRWADSRWWSWELHIGWRVGCLGVRGMGIGADVRLPGEIHPGNFVGRLRS